MSTTFTVKNRAKHQEVVDAIYTYVRDVIIPKYPCIFAGIPVRYEMNDTDLGKYVYNISAFVPGFTYHDRFQAVSLQIFDYPDQNRLNLRMAVRKYDMGKDNWWHAGVWEYKHDTSATAFDNRVVNSDRHETGTINQLIITPIDSGSVKVLKKFMQVFDKHCASLAAYYQTMNKHIGKDAREEINRQFKCAERNYKA